MAVVLRDGGIAVFVGRLLVGADGIRSGRRQGQRDGRGCGECAGTAAFVVSEMKRCSAGV